MATSHLITGTLPHFGLNSLRTFALIATAHLYRSLVRTSFSSVHTKSKSQQNIELMTFALTGCANIFVGCSVTATFFRQTTSFSDSFHYTKKQKKSVRGKF